MIFGVQIFVNFTVCPNLNEIISFYNMKGQTLGHLRSNCIASKWDTSPVMPDEQSKWLIYEMHLDKTGLYNYNKCLDYIWRGCRTIYDFPKGFSGMVCCCHANLRHSAILCSEIIV